MVPTTLIADHIFILLQLSWDLQLLNIHCTGTYTMRQPTGTYPAYPAQNPDSKPGAPPSNNLYGGQSSPNLYNPPSTGSLYSAPSHNSLFAPPPTNEKQQAGGQGQQYYQQSGNKGSVGGLGGSSWGLGTNDPEAGLDADIFDQQQRRRGSMLQVFGNELKKSWASLGNLTVCGHVFPFNCSSPTDWLARH